MTTNGAINDDKVVKLTTFVFSEWVSIGPGEGLSPIQSQSITQTNDDTMQWSTWVSIF